MKKGLSVLLIAAALFGFYGGATNLNDVLACKDYFESASGASDDMQRLEDGLNQLKDNEQAYLDGQVALAEGEKTLADGYATLADGEAQYAQGLKDYAAAPGKLAKGREGLASLRKAIQGINDLKANDGYPKWKKNYENMRNARNQFYAGTSTLAGSLKQLAGFLPEKDQKAYLAAVKDVAQDDGKQTYKDYNTYIQSTNELAKDLPVIQKNVKDQYNAATQLYNALKSQDTGMKFAALVSAKQKDILAMAPLLEQAMGEDAANSFKEKIATIASTYENYDQVVAAKTNEEYEKYMASDAGKQKEADLIAENKDAAMQQAWANAIAGAKQQAAKDYWASQGVENPTEEQIKAITDTISDAEAKAGFINSKFGGSEEAAEAYLWSQAEPTVKAQVDAGIKANVQSQVEAGVEATLKDAQGQMTVKYTPEQGNPIDGGVIGAIVAGLADVNKTLNAENSAINTTLLPGLEEFNDATKKNDEGKNGAKQLLEGQDDSIADGVRQLVSGILGDKTMKQNLIKKLGKAKVASMKKYGTKNSPLYSKKSDFAKFNDKMSKDPDVMQFLKDALPVVKARLAAGEKEYAEGLKSYKEAPAKLADARKQLADGRAQLADGEKQLADGKEQLAVYEDGEQQVRDGLATLVGTQPMGDVQGIADRIGNDTDFDNGDEHLELDEGLSAVQAGKGYASDLTAAVTDEIMSRAIATGLLIGAGVLAVLAALLSLLKKNKGAGVLAVLAAAAGCVGAFMGNAAGMQFSSIAGSTMGATPWVAAGILAAVAAVHAIVHFTAKKEA